MGNKYKILLVITCFLFLGIIGFSNKVEAGGCYTAHQYGAGPPGPLCNTWTDYSAYLHSCVENNSEDVCIYRYYHGGHCYGDWYDISCDSSNCGDYIECPVCHNAVTCPSCGEVKTCGQSGCNDAPDPHCTSGNTCNQNVCQINCGNGKTRVGNCTCVPNATPTPTFTPTPPPKTCGQSGCNIGGCTPSNMSCISDICQINNCPAGHSIVDNCNCLPPCSTLSTSFSQNACSLDISISGASPYLRNLAFSGPPVSTITQNILYRHTITSAGTKAWTLTWQEVASVGSATPRNCSTNISNTISPPSCGTANTYTDPSPPLWGNKVKLTAIISPPAGSTAALLNSSHPTIPSNLCDGGNILTVGENCDVPYIDGNPKVYSWTITWKTNTIACPAVENTSCVCPINSLDPNCKIEAENQPGYIKTTNGVSYIKTINLQPYFNAPNLPQNRIDSFSSNIFGSLNASAIAHTLPCSGNAINCTLKNYLLIGYTDINSSPSPSWYSYLKNPLSTNPKLNIIPTLTGSGINYRSVSGLVDNKVNVINIIGNLIIDGTRTDERVCNNSNIFLISGDLNITPDFNVAGLDDACLFIVGGTTRILESAKNAITCGIGNHINTTTVANPQDKVQAFIITNNFTTNTLTRPNTESAIQLLIKGGVITDTFTGGLNRNVNSNTCIFPNLPSELIDYEGARYIKNLRDALGDPTTISIFENQYKSTK